MRGMVVEYRERRFIHTPATCRKQVESISSHVWGKDLNLKFK
jgi:hypothetical protein